MKSAFRQAAAISTVLATAVVPLSCTRPDDSGRTSSRANVRVDTTRGFPVVNNPATGLWAPGEKWTVREVFRLGESVDGPPEEQFGTPLTSISIGPLGRIYVLEWLTQEVRVFDRRGRFVRSLGGKGRGPGELMSASAMAWDPAYRLWVANGFSGRYTVFDSAGEFLKTVPRPIHVLARNQHDLHFLDAGTLLDEGFDRGAALLLEVDTTGTVLDTVVRMPFPDRPRVFLPHGFDRNLVLYLNSQVWTVAPDMTVWVAHTGQLRLVHLDLNGDTLAVVETRHRDSSLDSENRNRVIREFAKLGVDESEYEPVRPVVQAIHVLDGGTVLVQIVEEVGQPSSLFDVFDPEGRYLGELRLGFRMTQLGLPATRGDTIVAVGIGAMDVPFVVRVVLERGGPG